MDGMEIKDEARLNPSQASGKPLESMSTSRVLDLSITQHPLYETTINEFTFSQHSLYESRTHPRLERDSIEGATGKESKKFFFLKPDSMIEDSSLSQAPIDEIALDLSSDALQSAILEISGEEEKTTGITFPLDTSKSILALTQYTLPEDINSQSLLNIGKFRHSQTEVKAVFKEQVTSDSTLSMKHLKDTLEEELKLLSGTSSCLSNEGHLSHVQPDVHHITIGDSYLEKRPISSSTPSASKYLSQLSIRESTHASPDESASFQSSQVGNSKPGDLFSENNGVNNEAGLIKAPEEVILEAGVIDYMLPEDRERLVGGIKGASMPVEEKEELFSGIFKPPPRVVSPTKSIEPGDDTDPRSCPKILMDQLAIGDGRSAISSELDEKGTDSNPHLPETEEVSKSVADVSSGIQNHDHRNSGEISSGASVNVVWDTFHELKNDDSPSSSYASSPRYTTMTQRASRDLDSLLRIGPTKPLTIIDRETPTETKDLIHADPERTSTDGFEYSGSNDEILLTSQPHSGRSTPHSRHSLPHSSRPGSSASARSLKDELEDHIDNVQNIHSGNKRAESPCSHMSETSSVSYQDLPEKIHHNLARDINKAPIQSGPTLSAKNTSMKNSDIHLGLDPDMKVILKKYGAVLSELEANLPSEKSISGFSNSRTPTESIAESDDTDLTSRVSRLLQGAEANRSYLMEDPANSVTLPLSGSTTRSITPQPTLSELGRKTTVQAVNRMPQDDINDKRLTMRSESQDTLGERVRHLLGDYLPGTSGGSSGRSSLSGSVNFDILQSDLDEIQRGLAVLQNGELSFKQIDNDSTGGQSRRMSNASDTISKVTGSEIGTPRKFSWDYGDLNAEDDSNYRFVTSRTAIHTTEKSPGRKEPEGGSGGSPKLSTSPQNKNSLSSLESKGPVEGKYTRIAMELEKETSPQRRMHLHQSPSHVREISPKRKEDTIFRNSDISGSSSLPYGLDSEVLQAFLATKSLSASEHSLSQKVQDLMERESPQRLAYKYLAEAEDSLRQIQLRNQARPHLSDGDLRDISMNSSAADGIRPSPIPQSFNAYGTVRTLLATQLNKVSSARFDTSIELKSPFKRHMGSDLSDQLAATSSPDLRTSMEDRSRTFEGSLSKGYARSVQVEVNPGFSEYKPSSRPVTMQDYLNGTRQSSLAERQQEQQRERALELERELKERVNMELATNSHDRKLPSETRHEKKSHQKCPEFATPKGKIVGKRPQTPSPTERVEDEFTPRNDSGVVANSMSSSGRRFARSEDISRSSRSPITNAGLRPYRPPGSNELYYVESVIDDGNVSVANSETTVESTHIGSDDARAPSFPHQWLGSRLEPPVASTGIYGGRTSSANSMQGLHTITENKSFEEARYDHKSRTDDSIENFAAQNRSHHNNSGQHNQTDSSSDRSEPATDSMYMAQGQEEGAWSADHHAAATPNPDSGPTYGNMSAAERYEMQGVEQAPGHNMFGTPHKHDTSSRSDDRTVTPQHSELYGTRLSEDTTGYGEEGMDEHWLSYGRNSNDLGDRLRPHPSESRATDSPVGTTSPNRFTPLRPDMDVDDIDERYRPTARDYTPSYAPSPPHRAPLRSPPPRSALTPPADRFPPSSHGYRARSPSPDRRPTSSTSSRARPYNSAPSTLHNSPKQHRTENENKMVIVASVEAPPEEEARGNFVSRVPSNGHGIVSKVSPAQAAREKEVEELASQLIPVDLPRENKDIQGLWEKFQQRTQSRSEASSESHRMDVGSLTSLFKNPVRYFVQDGGNANQGHYNQSDSLHQECGSVEGTASVSSMQGDHYQKDQVMDFQSRPQYEIGNVETNRDHYDYRPYGNDETSDRLYQENTRTSGGTPLSFVSSDIPLSSQRRGLRDENTLQSIPEDTTLSTTDITSSESNATISTLQLLPDDPKLLKIQTKILRQRQKYEHEKCREQRRKEKIQKLEKLLLSKSGHSSQSSPGKGRRVTKRPYHRDRSPPRPASSSSAKSTSTPSSVRGSCESDMSLTVSEITSDTLTQGTIISDQSFSTLLDMESQLAETPSRRNGKNETSICKCCLKKKSRSNGTPKNISNYASKTRSPDQRQRLGSRSPKKSQSNSMANQKTSRSPSPSPKRHTGHQVSENERSKKQKSRHLHDSDNRPFVTQENDTYAYIGYENPKLKDRSRSFRDNKASKSREGSPRKSRNESPRKSRDGSPKKSRDGSPKKSRDESLRKYKSNEETKNIPGENERRFREKRNQGQCPELLIPEEEDFSSPNCRTIGVNMPTPISLSPPTRKKIREVTMISEAVQTTPNLSRAQSRSPGRSKNQVRGPYSPSSDTDSSENIQPTPSAEKGRTIAGQTGLAWYIPVKESKPWRKPLKERQANALAMGDSWPPRRHAWQPDAEHRLNGGKRAGALDKLFIAEESEGNKITLQDSLERFRSDFISKSRERLKHLALKSEERKIQDIHARQRAELFHVERKMDPNKDAHPYSENLFKPKRRFMTKKEMKDLTNKKYATLEEVRIKKEEREKTEEYRANRIRAQMYKKKILNRVLNKKAAWTQ